jgi:hypothetical protein
MSKELWKFTTNRNPWIHYIVASNLTDAWNKLEEKHRQKPGTDMPALQVREITHLTAALTGEPSSEVIE